MQRSSTPMPARGLNDVLADDPEAASLLSEASHRDALASESAKAARECANGVRAARRRWDDLRHRLDPRGRRQVNMRVGLAVLVLITACLLVLDLPLLRGVMESAATLPLAACVTTTWLTAAWRGALAGREEQQRLRALIVAGTAGLSLLLVLVHSLAAIPRHAVHWHRFAAAAVTMLLIDALTAGATALISRIEPWDVATARTCWRRARKRHLRAERQERKDTEAASAARRIWLNFVREKTTAAPGEGGGDKVDGAAEDMLAAALSALDRPAMTTPAAAPRN